MSSSGEARQQNVDAMIEIPRGSRNKYEFDHKTGHIRLDRVLYSSVHYPTDYGLIPGTLSKDGDELDILVMVEEPTFPGCWVKARPIGALIMKDEKGEDAKILAAPDGDPRFDPIKELSDVPDHWLREIENFFATYKRLQDVETEIHGWKDRQTAWQIVEEARAGYRQALGLPHYGAVGQ